MPSWKEIKEGYGIEEIPRDMCKDLACVYCSSDFKNRKLYTTESIKTDGTIAGYSKVIKKLRTMCKDHAIWLYGEK